MKKRSVYDTLRYGKEPISRVLYYVAIYLGPASPQVSINLPSESDEQPSSLGLFGLSTHKVYLRRHH